MGVFKLLRAQETTIDDEMVLGEVVEVYKSGSRKGKPKVVKKGTPHKVRIKTTPLNTVEQARALDLARFQHSHEGRIVFANFIMRNAIAELTVDGEDYDPIELSETVQVGDSDEFEAFVWIATRAAKVLFQKEEDLKKSE